MCRRYRANYEQFASNSQKGKFKFVDYLSVNCLARNLIKEKKSSGMAINAFLIKQRRYHAGTA
jgi:hypothetical protein